MVGGGAGENSAITRHNDQRSYITYTLLHYEWVLSFVSVCRQYEKRDSTDEETYHRSTTSCQPDEDSVANVPVVADTILRNESNKELHYHQARYTHV